jgi:arylsulfatase A
MVRGNFVSANLTGACVLPILYALPEILRKRNSLNWICKLHMRSELSRPLPTGSLLTQPRFRRCSPYVLAAIIVAAASCFPAAGDAQAAAPSGAPRGPNIVLILADDLGYGDIGCYGATKVKTPNLDRLAREGRRFTDAHSASAVCTPSRYALLTGEYPFRKDLWGPAHYTRQAIIAPTQTTVASLLKERGYATACFGKWHLGFGSEKNPDWNQELKPGPLEFGFDHYYGIPVVNSSPPYVWVEDRRVVGLDPDDPLKYGGIGATKEFPEKVMAGVSGGRAAHEAYRDEELGTTLTEKATGWIRNHREKPFFVYFATPHIHHPFTPGKRFAGSSGCGRYGDFIQEFDWMVGEIDRTLDELKLRDNTLLIVTSDNGGMLNQGGQDAWTAGHRLNGDLLGFKFDAWEGGHRVPFVARRPGKIAPGTVSDQLICHVDFLATAAALTVRSTAEEKLSDDAGPDSFNVLPALLGSPTEPIRDHLILTPARKEMFALRNGSLLYINGQGGGGFKQTNPGDHALGGPAALKFTGEVNSDIADGAIKPGAPPEQLYDLATDPRQTKNLAAERPEVVALLREQLRALQAKPRTRP